MARRGRPRGFDEDAAVGEITRTFWERGYAETSVQDLVESSGVQRNSLYTAFGNKKALLLLALARYRSEVTGTLQGLTHDGPVLPALRAFLTIPLDPSRPATGCLLGNTTVEVAGHDPDVLDVVRQNFDALAEIVRGLIERAYQTGELPRGDSAAQAQLLVAIQQGLQVISRATADPTRLSAAVDAALDGLRHPVGTTER